MKYAGSQSSISPGMFKQLGEMLGTACAAGCNNRNAYRPFYRANQLKVKTVAGSVTVNAVEQNLTGPEFLTCPGQGYGVNRSALAPSLDGAFIPAPALTFRARSTGRDNMMMVLPQVNPHTPGAGRLKQQQPEYHTPARSAQSNWYRVCGRS